jgi:hypothetical protein
VENPVTKSTSTAIVRPENNNEQLAKFGEMSVAAITERKRKIGEVMHAVMKDGEHYGTVPGCGPKPTLLKAGAEVLATTFGLAPTFDIKRTDLENGHREYEITCTLHHIATGAVLGEGVGCCSTMESKYRWRKGQRECPSCHAPAIMKSKYEDGGWYCFDKRGGCGMTFHIDDERIAKQETGRVENPDIADAMNTVLKIAKKRAQVDATLTAVGASDLLTQDLEDLPPRENNFAPGQQDAELAAAARAKAQTHKANHDLNPDDELEAAAIALIKKIQATTNELELGELDEEGARLPKGSRARAAAWEAFQVQRGKFGK